MSNIASHPKEMPRSAASVAFDQNLEFLKVILALRHHDVVAAKAATRRLAADVKKYASKDKERLAKALENLDRRIKKTLGRLTARLEIVTLWEVVMLVTCVEAYLQDILSEAARIDLELMIKSEQQVARYADVIAASSLETLASSLRTQWARSWLNAGGPARWIERFEKLGARGYGDDLAGRLERIWGIRHVVVHSAGVATAEFVRLHPGVVAAPGERVKLDYRELSPWLQAVKEFIEPTEHFFIKRYPALIVKS